MATRLDIEGVVSKTDVLVVGAGPAGLAAARALVESGARVALIDRQRAPGGKACGGGFTSNSWPLAGIDPDNLPAHALAHRTVVVKTKIGTARLGGSAGEPGGRHGTLLVTIDRRVWAREQLSSLAAKGVEVGLGEQLSRVADGHAVTSLGRRDFDFLIAADGASSRVRRHLGLQTGLAMHAWQFKVRPEVAKNAGLALTEPTVWFDTGRFSSGYAWGFPLSAEWRFGCAASSAVSRTGALKRSFYDWLGALGLGREMGTVESGTIPCGYAGHRFRRVFLAGDAAGLASPVTGEGIAQALISGAEIAREITEPGYRSGPIAALAARHRRTHDTLAQPLVCRALYGLSPWLLGLKAVRERTLARYVA